MDFDIKGYIKYWEALNDAVLLAASSPLCANIFFKSANMGRHRAKKYF